MLAGLRNIRTFESLAVRDYRLLWLGQVSTSLGQWMDQVTRAWLIYILTGSAFQLGLTTAVRGLPILLFGMVAGRWRTDLAVSSNSSSRSSRTRHSTSSSPAW